MPAIKLIFSHLKFSIMKNSFGFFSFHLRMVLFLLYSTPILFMMSACEKQSSELSAETVKVSQKSSIHPDQFKSLSDRIKLRSSVVLLSGRGDPIPPEEANDLVEGTLNYDYCDASSKHFFTDASDTLIVVPLTSGEVEEEDVEQLYLDAEGFAGRHFNGIEEEDKTPFVYDFEIESSTSTTVSIRVNSVVATGTVYSPWSRRTFGSGDYEAMYGVEERCNSQNKRHALKELANFTNYNLNPGNSYYYLAPVQGNEFLTDNAGHEVLWRFKCSVSGQQCCNLCTSCLSYDLDEIYCLDQTGMNDLLDESENDVFTGNTYFVQTGYDFGRIHYTDNHRYCQGNGAREDRWMIKYYTGVRIYDPHTLKQF